MKKLAIRRAILDALATYENPQNLETVCHYYGFAPIFQTFCLTDTDKIAILREWEFLREHGYLEPVTGFEGYRRLSADLRAIYDEQRRDPARVSPLRKDPFLYGPDAL